MICWDLVQLWLQTYSDGRSYNIFSMGIVLSLLLESLVMNKRDEQLGNKVQDA